MRHRVISSVLSIFAKIKGSTARVRKTGIKTLSTEARGTIRNKIQQRGHRSKFRDSGDS